MDNKYFIEKSMEVLKAARYKAMEPYYPPGYVRYEVEPIGQYNINGVLYNIFKNKDRKCLRHLINGRKYHHKIKPPEPGYRYTTIGCNAIVWYNMWEYRIYKRDAGWGAHLLGFDYLAGSLFKPRYGAKKLRDLRETVTRDGYYIDELLQSNPMEVHRILNTSRDYSNAIVNRIMKIEGADAFEAFKKEVRQIEPETPLNDEFEPAKKFYCWNFTPSFFSWASS